MVWVIDMQCVFLFIRRLIVYTISSPFIAFVYADLLILLRPSTAVMATKSRHVSEVMATVQITTVAEEKKELTHFFGIGSI